MKQNKKSKYFQNKTKQNEKKRKDIMLLKNLVSRVLACPVLE